MKKSLGSSHVNHAEAQANDGRRCLPNKLMEEPFMSSGAKDVSPESKSSTVSPKWIRCKDCAFAEDRGEKERVWCPKYGYMYKTNSCIYRKAK